MQTNDDYDFFIQVSVVDPKNNMVHDKARANDP